MIHLLRLGIVLAALPSLTPGTAAAAAAATTGQVCNNYAALCSRSYDNVTQLGAHNSPFLRDGSQGLSSAGSQYYNSTLQLDYGVRLLSAEVRMTTANNTLRLCHSSCELFDAGPLVDWLSAIRTWLGENPSNVVTLLLVNPDRVDVKDLAAAYTASSADNISHVPAATAASPSAGLTWPSLAELIGNGTNLVTFVDTFGSPADDDDRSGAPYLLSEYDYVFETPYNNTSPQDLLRCGLDRPASLGGNTATGLARGLLPLVNQVLYDNTSAISFMNQTVEQPDEAYADVTNAPGLAAGLGNLGSKMDLCKGELGRPPWAVLVDFFNVGPAIKSIDSLNGVGAGAVGRRQLDGSAPVQRGGAMGGPAVKEGLLWWMVVVAVAGSVMGLV